MKSTFFVLIFLLCIEKILAKNNSNPTSMEDDVSLTTIEEFTPTMETLENQEVPTTTIKDVIEAMEKLSFLLKNDIDLPKNVGDILKSTSTVSYLLNDSLIYDFNNASDKMLENFQTTKQIFLESFLKNQFTLNSTQKSLESLFNMHKYKTKPYVINSNENALNRSFDSHYICKMPIEFYESVTGNSSVKFLSINNLQTRCGQIDFQRMYDSLTFGYFSMGIYAILKNEYFNDQTYDLIHEFIISLIKEMIMMDSICEKVVNVFHPYPVYKPYKIKSYNFYISNIMEKLEDKNLQRKKEFWSLNVTSTLIKKTLDLNNATQNDKIAKILSEGMKQNYTKTGYVFGVGVYKSINENYDHAFYGNDVFIVSNYTNKNVFIMRTETSKIYKQCSILNSIENYENEICHQTNQGRNLPSLIKWIHKQCSDLAAIAIVRINLNFQGFTPKNGMMSKNIKFNNCHFGFTLIVAFKADK